MSKKKQKRDCSIIVLGICILTILFLGNVLLFYHSDNAVKEVEKIESRVRQMAKENPAFTAPPNLQGVLVQNARAYLVLKDTIIKLDIKAIHREVERQKVKKFMETGKWE